MKVVPLQERMANMVRLSSQENLAPNHQSKLCQTLLMVVKKRRVSLNPPEPINMPPLI
jgi:hypothetical protein